MVEGEKESTVGRVVGGTLGEGGGGACGVVTRARENGSDAGGALEGSEKAGSAHALSLRARCGWLRARPRGFVRSLVGADRCCPGRRSRPRARRPWPRAPRAPRRRHRARPGEPAVKPQCGQTAVKPQCGQTAGTPQCGQTAGRGGQPLLCAHAPRDAPGRRAPLPQAGPCPPRRPARPRGGTLRPWPWESPPLSSAHKAAGCERGAGGKRASTWARARSRRRRGRGRGRGRRTALSPSAPLPARSGS